MTPVEPCLRKPAGGDEAGGAPAARSAPGPDFQGGGPLHSHARYEWHDADQGSAEKMLLSRTAVYDLVALMVSEYVANVNIL